MLRVLSFFLARVCSGFLCRDAACMHVCVCVCVCVRLCVYLSVPRLLWYRSTTPRRRFVTVFSRLARRQKKHTMRTQGGPLLQRDSRRSRRSGGDGRSGGSSSERTRQGPPNGIPGWEEKHQRCCRRRERRRGQERRRRRHRPARRTDDRRRPSERPQEAALSPGRAISSGTARAGSRLGDSAVHQLHPGVHGDARLRLHRGRTGGHGCWCHWRQERHARGSGGGRCGP